VEAAIIGSAESRDGSIESVEPIFDAIGSGESVSATAEAAASDEFVFATSDATGSEELLSAISAATGLDDCSFNAIGSVVVLSKASDFVSSKVSFSVAPLTSFTGAFFTA
jgi:hypothetical protein